MKDSQEIKNIYNQDSTQNYRNCLNQEAIASHPAVFDVAVIGIPHDKWGEAVMAVVILKEGSHAAEEDIINHCRDKMAGYKKPKAVKFIPQNQMPRTASGKIIHRKLRDMFT